MATTLNQHGDADLRSPTSNQEDPTPVGYRKDYLTFQMHASSDYAPVPPSGSTTKGGTTHPMKLQSRFVNQTNDEK